MSVLMPPKGSNVMFPSRSTGKIWIKPAGAPDSELKEIGEFAPGRGISNIVIDEKEDPAIKQFSSASLDFSAEVHGDFTPLLEMCEREQLKGLVDFVKMAHKEGFVRSGRIEIADDKFRYMSRLCHKLYNENLTRFFAENGLKKPYFNGFHVLLPSGCWVWKK